MNPFEGKLTVEHAHNAMLKLLKANTILTTRSSEEPLRSLGSRGQGFLRQYLLEF